VRFRRNERFGSGLESITRAKQQRLTKAARHLLMRYPKFSSWPCRFDVVSVSKRNCHARLDWIQGAF
jgi:putative endonuclease